MNEIYVGVVGKVFIVSVCILFVGGLDIFLCNEVVWLCDVSGLGMYVLL